MTSGDKPPDERGRHFSECLSRYDHACTVLFETMRRYVPVDVQERADFRLDIEAAQDNLEAAQRAMWDALRDAKK